MELCNVPIRTYDAVPLCLEEIGLEIPVIREEGKTWLALRAVCDELGITFKDQVKRLIAAPWALVWHVPMATAHGRPFFETLLLSQHVVQWAATLRGGESDAADRLLDRAFHIAFCIDLLVCKPTPHELAIRQAEAMRMRDKRRKGRPRTRFDGVPGDG
jgi:hypothetical protein